MKKRSKLINQVFDTILDKRNVPIDQISQTEVT
jgi:hypothetical protein